MQLLVDAAGRAVDVRLLTSGTRTDVKITRLAARSQYAILLAAGVRAYEYRPTNMHAKTFVVDGSWTAIGTMNFDNRSLAYNNEDALVALDTSLGADMDAMFLDDLRRSDEIRLEIFNRRPGAQRLFRPTPQLPARSRNRPTRCSRGGCKASSAARCRRRAAPGRKQA
jgi:cardiolipin synthase